MPNEQDGEDADGHAFDSNEPTVVIARRLSRPEISSGMRKLATGVGGFRANLFRGADFLDEGTKAGLPTLTMSEAEDLDADLEAWETRIRGVRASLNRAIGKGPRTDP